MIKSSQGKLTQSFLSLCQQRILFDPPSHIINMLSESSVIIQSQKVKHQDLKFIKIMLYLKVSSICFVGSQDQIQSQLVEIIIQSIKHSQKGLQQLTFQNCQILHEYSKQFSIAIAQCKSLKILNLVNCNLNDAFFEKILPSLILNNQLRSLNISSNKLTILKELIQMLEQQSLYKNQKIERFKIDYDDVAEKQIMQLNFSKNLIPTTQAIKFAQYLKKDKWVRGVNLNGNKIESQAIEAFSHVLEQNKGILKLDLRNNPGWNIEASNTLFTKMSRNTNQWKKKNQCIEKRGNNSADFGYTKANNKNITVNHGVVSHEHLACENCKKLCFKTLRLEKKILDLRQQIVRLKKILQNRGFQISVINPSTQHHTEQISFSAKNMVADSFSSDDIIHKIQTMMSQLTKILQIQQVQHNTQGDITNPLYSTHNLSNTVQILANNQNSLIVPLPEQDDQLSDIQ